MMNRLRMNVSGVCLALCLMLIFSGALLPASIPAFAAGITNPETYNEDVFAPPETGEDEEFGVGDQPSMYGTYRLNAGYIDDEWTIREADYVLQEETWRYLYGPQTYNTYDPAVYNQLVINADVPLSSADNIHLKANIDPWSFVGSSGEVTLPTYYEADDGSGTTPVDDPVTLRLKYWSNNSRVFPQFVRSEQGDTFALSDVYVSGGYNDAFRSTGTYGFESHRLDVPSLKFDDEFKPLRSLWYEHAQEENRAVVFAYAEGDMSIYGDDPMRILTNHINWEPSPWLDKWVPGRDYQAGGWQDGEWAQEYHLRDSEGKFLTLLRGVRLETELAGWQTQAMAAAPVEPWDDYNTVNNVPLGVRMKHELSDVATLGTVYTARWAFEDGSEDARDQAAAVDIRADVFDDASVFGEAAYSVNSRNRTEQNFQEDTDDTAYQIGVEGPIAPFDIAMDGRITFTRMGPDFDPPLANYSNTRDDQGWSNHIWFYRRSQEEESYRLGNSIDADRRVVGLNLKVKQAEGVDSDFNFRAVNRDTDGEFIENIFRNETAYQASPDFLTKFLVILHQRENDSEGKRLDAATFGAGGKYKFSRYVSLEHQVERTNEYPGFPGELYPWLTINPPPAYPYYWISKTVCYIEPFGWMRMSLEYCYNEFDYASTYDDFMNYSGTQMLVRLTEECDLNFGYTYSRVADFNRNSKTIGHHNIFSELRYRFSDRHLLSLSFGVMPVYVQGQGWGNGVLDTQHIVRAAFTGEY